METRFGSLPQWAEDKIRNADVAAIENRSIKVLSANSVEEMLRDKMHQRLYIAGWKKQNVQYNPL